MTDMLDIDPRLEGAGGRRYETFSYLAPFSPEQIRDQLRYVIGRGWTCAIEYVEPRNASHDYWYMWKLPLFGVTDAEAVLGELEACRAAHPHCLVRLIGYDNIRQTQGTAFVVYRPEKAAGESG